MTSMALLLDNKMSVTIGKFLNALYLATSVIGAILVALNLGYQFIGYVLFFISSCSGMFIAIRSNAPSSLVIVNGMFAVINIIGLISYGGVNA